MVRTRGTLWGIFFLFAALCVPSLASADPIAVTGGYLFMSGTSGPIELSGERGFSLTSRVSVTGGIFNPREQCGVPECPPGTEVSLFAHWVGNDLSGDLSFEGQTYDDLGGLNSFAQASVTFLGSFITPAMGAEAMVTAPFRFEGRFSVPNEANNDYIAHTLFGGGTATIRLVPHGSAFPDQPTWEVSSVRYQFSETDPVPEPGTMMLVGLGIAGVARKVRQRRANGSRVEDGGGSEHV